MQNIIDNINENSDIIGSGTFGKVYKTKIKGTNQCFAIKEFELQKKDRKAIYEEIKIMKIMNTENSVSFMDSYETKKKFYIKMELCDFNLEEYIQKRDPFSINEIKYLLNQLNNAFKIMNQYNIIHRDLKPSNILISVKQIDKCLIKLTDYGSSNFESNMTGQTIDHTPLYSSPELLKGETINTKSDIWSLGIIIYYLLNKEHPYKGKNEYLLLKDIKSGKKLTLTKDELLNNLINKMLTFNVHERISWDEYFEHPFFNETKNSTFEIPSFNFFCNKHSTNFSSYCVDCKKNICIKCKEKHSSHYLISFDKIGLNENEIKQIENIFEELDENINSFNKIKEDIQNVILKMKSIQENVYVYDKDIKNNYKEFYIKYLEMMNKNIKYETKLPLINLPKITNKNEINCIYDIKKGEEMNEERIKIQILNSYEEIKRNYGNFPSWDFNGTSENEDELKNCDIFINNKRIPFCYNYEFPKEGKYKIKFVFYKPLTNLNFMFYDCNQLKSINLSDFNTEKVNNMSNMFSNCSSLKTIDISNFNTENVTNMDSMFSNCYSLTELNLSNFNTENVSNMSYMFSNCSSLTELDLSNFNTENVSNMSYMFSDCSSLLKLSISNFKNENVSNMSYMFSDCSSLSELNLSNFTTAKVVDMSYMFSDCSSLSELNLSNFNTENVINMESMFSNCSSLIGLHLSNFDTKLVNKMSNMFSNCSSLKELNVSSFNTKKVEDMNFMFKNCSSLTSLDLDNFYTNKLIEIEEMFKDCSSLSSLKLKNFTIDKVFNFNNIFFGCNSLRHLDISNFRKNNFDRQELLFGLNHECRIICNDDTLFLFE